MEFAMMQAILAEAYGCCHEQATASGNTWDAELAKLMTAEVERIWKAKGMPSRLNDELTAAYASVYNGALQEGYGVNLSEVDYDSPDADMLHNLTQNIYAFSAAKNYTQLQQLTRALIGDDGKLRTFSQFKQAAFTISNEHNLLWLKTEYDTAIGSAQMARKWVEIQANKQTLPLLQFDAVIDSRTSDTCRPLEGIVRPVDDKFWDMYYPPNHFKCRSTVRQLASGVITSDDKITTPEKLQALFKTNLAKQGMIFPPKHPYWDDIGELVIRSLRSTLRKDVLQWAKENLLKKLYPANNVGDVGFTVNSLKEILHKPHFDMAKRNLSVYNLPEILKNAELVKVDADSKGNPEVVQWYYLKYYINGRPSYVNIKELKNKDKVVYAITDTLK